MENKPNFRLDIGGGFKAQPKHKPKIIPRDFLVHFCNTRTDQAGSIINFANQYNFGFYLYPEKDLSMQDKFQILHEKYRPIIYRLIKEDSLNYSDILNLNEVLKNVSPAFSLRSGINDLENIEEGFAVYTLCSSEDEEPEYEVTPIGSFDADRVTKATCVNIKIKKPQNSDSKWYSRRIIDGVTKVRSIFPSESWDAVKNYMKSVVLQSTRIELDKTTKQPIATELNLRLGKTNFLKEEVAAIWSPSDGESFIAKRIWDYFNTEYKGSRFKLCKICGDLHAGRSPDYCNKNECFKEWDSRRKLLKR